MKIKDILGIENAKILWGNENTILDNFSKDTRTIKTDDTYIGLIGENFDGNLFFEEAFKKGAKTCIVSTLNIDLNLQDKYPNTNLIWVSDTLKFLTSIAKKKRDNLNIPVIAVTGSVGKTSTKNIIADILSLKYKVLKTAGNLNTDIGLALTILAIKDEEIIVLEMGMSDFGEISTLTNIAKPNVAVITNIGTAHIGNLGSRENILKAKLEIIEGLKDILIVNNDNDLLHDWIKTTNISPKIITYGIENKSDYEASNLTFNQEGSHYEFKTEKITLNVLGSHFIYNSLVALAIADIYKIPLNLVKEKLNNLVLEPDRMELIYKDNYTIINDTYNASYDSLYYALEVLSYFKGRTIAVLGDILELGDFSEEIHRKIGSLIVKNKIDILITVGSNAKYINDEVKKLGYNIYNYHFETNEEAIVFIKNMTEKNDTILIKASHGMNFKEIVLNL